MTTQAMYDNGLRCRGKGFNCNVCKDSDECVEYVPIQTYIKPPLGIEPKDIWIKKRFQDLKDAISRYNNASLEIPMEWIDEYNELLKIVNKEEI